MSAAKRRLIDDGIPVFGTILPDAWDLKNMGRYGGGMARMNIIMRRSNPLSNNFADFADRSSWY